MRRHRAAVESRQLAGLERRRTALREEILRDEFGDEWVDAGHSLPSRRSVVLRSLLFPGLGHRSIHDDADATHFFIAGAVSWIACFVLAGWFFLFGALFLALPFLHIYAARAAGERWDRLQGFPVADGPDDITAWAVSYGPDGPIASETHITGVRGRRSR